MAARQIDHFERVRDRLAELGVDVMVAMQPFHAPFNAFHEHTKPKDWLEGLVKAYVGDGFAADFYREVAAFVDADTRALVYEVLSDEGHADVRRREGPGRDRGRPARSPAGSPCGAAGWSGRRSARPSGSPPTGTP